MMARAAKWAVFHTLPNKWGETMLLDTTRTGNFALQQRQLLVQQEMLAEALADKANSAFEVGPREEQPVHLLPEFKQMASQQQRGGILNISDAEREKTRLRQYEAQKAMLEKNIGERGLERHAA
jgi:hypothetical protein